MRSFRRPDGSGADQVSPDVAGMAGLEPTISESKSGVLPLHYIPLLLRFKRQVGGERGRQCRPLLTEYWDVV